MAKRHGHAATRPFSIRLTESERHGLVARAGTVPVGAYVRGLLLGELDQPRKAQHRSPVEHSELLARILALLGQSELAKNLKTLTRHADEGTLYLDEASIRCMRQAAEAMLAMRLLLLHALGKRGTPEEAIARQTLSDAFRDRAAPSAYAEATADKPEDRL